MESFHGNSGGARELLTKEQKGLFLGLDVFASAQENGKGFIMQIASFYRGLEGPWDKLLLRDQKTPDLLIKNMFLGEAENAISLGMKSQFGIPCC